MYNASQSTRNTLVRSLTTLEAMYNPLTDSDYYTNNNALLDRSLSRTGQWLHKTQDNIYHTVWMV